MKTKSWWRYYVIYIALMACLYPAWWAINRVSHAWSYAFWGAAILAGMTGANKIQRRFWGPRERA